MSVEKTSTSTDSAGLTAIPVRLRKLDVSVSVAAKNSPDQSQSTFRQNLRSHTDPKPYYLIRNWILLIKLGGRPSSVHYRVRLRFLLGTD